MNATIFFPNWGSYSVADLYKNYGPITDVNYAFLDLRPSPKYDDHLVPTWIDPWADVEKRFVEKGSGVGEPDSWNDPPGLVYGNIGQFTKLKSILQGALRFGVSIGGWTLSRNFSAAVATSTSRKYFVKACVDLIKAYPVIQRIDLDWEYPSKGENFGAPGNVVDPAGRDPENYALLLLELRKSLDSDFEAHIEITCCVSASPEKSDCLEIALMANCLDRINLMSYDFASSAWGSCLAGHHANLFSTSYALLSVDKAVGFFLSRGVPSSKIVVGIAAYSRAFAETSGIGCESHGAARDGEGEDLDGRAYRRLPPLDFEEHWDDRAKATYAYNARSRILLSYDDSLSVREKCKYVDEKKLGGVMLWEIGGDFPIDNSRSLLGAIMAYQTKF
ncbi:MAG: hypothetical protein SGCHY_004687 [Lobulomycetales sp.]